MGMTADSNITETRTKGDKLASSGFAADRAKAASLPRIHRCKDNLFGEIVRERRVFCIYTQINVKALTVTI
jgi:hypothetical protein